MTFTLPPLAEVLASTSTVSIPTRTSFRGIHVREAIILRGAKRWSEFSPFTEYADDEAAAWLRAALEYGWADLPEPKLQQVAVNATVPAVAAVEVADVLARFPGCKTVKVKVAEKGQTLADDVARVAAVRKVVGDETLVRIDANAAWSLTEATEALEALQGFDLDYAEQPVQTITDLARLRQQFFGRIKIAADESVRKATDPFAVAQQEAADLLVVKAQPLGGVLRAREIVREAGLPVVVSSALDTSIGIAMGARLAASLSSDELYGACGLGTVALLNGDVVKDSLIPKDGSIPVVEAAADPELLTKFAASKERHEWWMDRVKRCYNLLTSKPL